MQAVFELIIFFLGAAVGSFAAASAYRTENKKPILFGRSECVSCGRKLKSWELVPVFSYLFLRGRCHGCKKLIGPELFLMEMVCGVLYAAAYKYHAASAVLLARDWVFVGVLAYLAFYDSKYGVLPDAISIPSIIIVFGLNLAAGYNILNLGLAVLCGGGFFGAQWLVSRGRWVGGGDVRMGALLGAALGWPGLVPVIFIAYILGAAAALVLLFSNKKDLKSQIAFGAFLSVGGAVALFWGDKILNWYLQI